MKQYVNRNCPVCGGYVVINALGNLMCEKCHYVLPDSTTATITIPKSDKYIKQKPYVGDDGIYCPVNEYVQEGCASAYRLIISKELFIEAYNKWIKEPNNDSV